MQNIYYSGDPNDTIYFIESGQIKLRLGQTLLQLARTMGKKDPNSIRIERRISHEELSEMVGTTRPRISLFMQRFHRLGLIETNKDHFFIIKEKKLTGYLAQISKAASWLLSPEVN